MHNYYQLFYHLIWSTKNREPLVTVEIEKLLTIFLPTKIKIIGGNCYAIGIVSDHIHLDLSIPPNISISSFVQKIKGSSAYSINNTFLNQHFNWQSGYGVLSFSKKSLPYIEEYIKNQKNHHQGNSLLGQLECDHEVE
jgi:REP element-mobilizing transposase RayT